MKATITIEVPDDFKKGECEKCPINCIKEEPLGCWHYLFNCPLEILEKKDCTLEQDLTMLELD